MNTAIGIVSVLLFLAYCGYKIYSIVNKGKDDKLSFENENIILRDSFDTAFRDQETKHFRIVKELIDKVERLKKESKQYLDLLSKCEVKVRALTPTQEIPTEDTGAGLEEVPRLTPPVVAPNTSKKSRKK